MTRLKDKLKKGINNVEKAKRRNAQTLFCHLCGFIFKRGIKCRCDAKSNWIYNDYENKWECIDGEDFTPYPYSDSVSHYKSSALLRHEMEVFLMFDKIKKEKKWAEHLRKCNEKLSKVIGRSHKVGLISKW